MRAEVLEAALCGVDDGRVRPAGDVIAPLGQRRAMCADECDLRVSASAACIRAKVGRSRSGRGWAGGDKCSRHRRGSCWASPALARALAQHVGLREVRIGRVGRVDRPRHTQNVEAWRWRSSRATVCWVSKWASNDHIGAAAGCAAAKLAPSRLERLMRFSGSSGIAPVVVRGVARANTTRQRFFRGLLTTTTLSVYELAVSQSLPGRGLCAE